MVEPEFPLPASGPQPGEHLSAFIVADVTGKFPGEHLCYVCYLGEGPVAAVFAREIDDRLARLAGDLDRWVEQHPGARAFVAVPGNDPEGDAEALQELARAYSIRLPLTVCAEGEFGPHLYRLHPRVPVTVLLYREKTVVRSLSARAPDEAFRALVLQAAEALIRPSEHPLEEEI
jgi:hypothetical protein